MKKILIYTFLLLFTSVYAFGANTDEARYNKLSKSYTLNPDGSQEVRISKELTLFTHNAMNSTFGESFITYNPKFQELVIHQSYTKQKDGTIIKTPENAFVEVLPRQAADAPAYNHLREMVVVHTGLDLGCTIYLDYSIVSQAGYLPALDIFERVREAAPVKDYSITITVPENKPLNYALINASWKPKTSTVNGMKTLSWRLKNISVASRAPQVTIQDGSVEVLAANTYSDASQMYANILNVNVSQLPSAGKDVESILKYVRDNYAVSPLPFKEAGFRIRPLEDIISSGYGTEAELTALAYQLMKNAAIDARILSCSPVNSASPAISKALGMSASNLFIYDGKLHSVTMPTATIDRLPKNWLTFREISAPYSTIPVPASDVKIAFEKEIEYDGSSMLTLPLDRNGIAYSGIDKYNSTRKENLLLAYPIDETYNYTIKLKDGVKISIPTGEKIFSNKVGTIKSSVSLDGNTLHITRSISIPNQFITPAMYKEFKALVAQWCDRNQITLL